MKSELTRPPFKLLTLSLSAKARPAAGPALRVAAEITFGSEDCAAVAWLAAALPVYDVEAAVSWFSDGLERYLSMSRLAPDEGPPQKLMSLNFSSCMMQRIIFELKRKQMLKTTGSHSHDDARGASRRRDVTVAPLVGHLVGCCRLFRAADLHAPAATPLPAIAALAAGRRTAVVVAEAGDLGRQRREDVADELVDRA